MIRCMAIDDEPLALQQIVTYINKVPFLELAAQCQSALEARQFLEQDTVDQCCGLPAQALWLAGLPAGCQPTEGEKPTPNPTPKGGGHLRRHHLPEDGISHRKGQHQQHPLYRGHERVPEGTCRRREQAHHHPAVDEEDRGATARLLHAHPPLVYRQPQDDSGGQQEPNHHGQGDLSAHWRYV